MFYEILTWEDVPMRQKWEALCNLLGCDIFFTPEYAYLWELNGDGQATCFVYYETDKDFVLNPFLTRQINNIPIFNDLPNNIVDIITPYGYGGYLRSSERVNMDAFFDIFNQYCKENCIVSEFIRFNPVLKNHSYTPKKVFIQHWNDTVVIDLTLSIAGLWKQLTKGCRAAVKKAQKNKVIIVNDEKFANLDAFYNLYYATMDRVNAHKYYFFSKDWFKAMVKLLNNNMALFHGIYQNEIIASSIFLFTDTVIHYFLAGSSYEMRHLAANNLLLFEVALWAKSRGIKYFHLGGGYQPNDTLFKFKASFSPCQTHYYIGKVIHDTKYYQFLKTRRLAAGGNSANDSDFFPEYRVPIRVFYESI
ncbi:MAG: GNAT family N-acetyltransferase [Deltaproteobacteria bacterium]|nr:GNAT family N-acetyltransferase [Deltaproteobacteria bacterium]MBW2135168.1 GNAT family N-acetyltransferase [Deltaproteobacteria bacterium]